MVLFDTDNSADLFIQNHRYGLDFLQEKNGLHEPTWELEGTKDYYPQLIEWIVKESDPKVIEKLAEIGGLELQFVEAMKDGFSAWSKAYRKLEKELAEVRNEKNRYKRMIEQIKDKEKETRKKEIEKQAIEAGASYVYKTTTYASFPGDYDYHLYFLRYPNGAIVTDEVDNEIIHYKEKFLADGEADDGKASYNRKPNPFNR
jgi:vacuolar-type H+-ATPase subunit I/STV1